MTTDTQAQIDTIGKRVADYNCFHDTSKSLFSDTETTGGGRDDQIIEIVFCDSERNLIIDTLLNKPTFIDT